MTNQQNTPTFNRRTLLKSSAGLGGALLIGAPLSTAWGAVPMLTVGSRTIEVNKKAAKVLPLPVGEQMSV